MASHSHSHLSSLNADSLVKSIISKMMYTCTNIQCKHRLARGSGAGRHYNCPGFPRLEGPIYGSGVSLGSRGLPCGCYAGDNPEEEEWSGKKSKGLAQSRYSGKCLQCIPAAGDYSRQQWRGRWVNNSLHSGKKMKKIIYESENPNSRVQSGPFAKNYDTQYRIMQQRIQRTRAPSPQGHTKIASLVRRDRDRRR